MILIFYNKYVLIDLNIKYSKQCLILQITQIMIYIKYVYIKTYLLAENENWN